MAIFSTSSSPIAFDFGASTVKMLQIVPGEPPEVVAAAEIEVPDAARGDIEDYVHFLSKSVPAVLKSGGFKGKRAVFSPPPTHTYTQHMKLSLTDGVSLPELAAAQLQIDYGCSPSSVVVRAVDVTDTNVNGQPRRETICLAIAKRTVMRLVELLKRCKLETTGVHAEALLLLRAFAHIHRRKGDDQITTMYVDLGWSGTNMAIGHGSDLVFSRKIDFGGRHLDTIIAETLHCDEATARKHRLAQSQWHEFTAANPGPRRVTAEGGAEGSAILRSAMSQSDPPGGGGTAAAVSQRKGGVPSVFWQPIAPGEGQAGPSNVDLSEPLEILTEELAMSLRYHQTMFASRMIDRIVFLGGEARQIGLCQRIAAKLGASAQLGDPLARMKFADLDAVSGFDARQPQPGWAVACGLCTAPTDL